MSQLQKIKDGFEAALNEASRVHKARYFGEMRGGDMYLNGWEDDGSGVVVSLKIDGLSIETFESVGRELGERVRDKSYSGSYLARPAKDGIKRDIIS